MSMAISNPRRVSPIVGEIIDASKLNKTGSEYDVINFKVKTVTKNSLGLTMKAVKRVCLFFEQAVEAASELKAGDFACFDECSTQDRVYTSKNSGEKVMTSDIIAKQYVKISLEDAERIQGVALEQAETQAKKSGEFDDLDDIFED